MNIVAIIPARGGSKRLKNKNLYPLLGKPLIQWTIDEALKSEYIQDIFVSTEDLTIKQAVLPYCKVIDRPKNLAEDHIWMQEPITHAVKQIPYLKDSDLIVILQANSPEIKYEKIDECIKYVLDHNLWQMSTVDSNHTNNSHICVIKKEVCFHQGKANYNGFKVVNWIDVHNLDDLKQVEKRLSNEKN